MANEFSFLNYHTEYSSTGDHNRSMHASACFAEIFNDGLIKDCSYEIRIYKGNVKLRESKSNACFLTKQELINHINIVKYLFDFEFSVKEEDNRFVVKLKIENRKNIFHKYLLNWIRYTYEFPYNMLHRDALWLKKSDPKYKFESIFNLYLLTSHCYDGNYGTSHSLIHCGKFMTQKELKKKIPTVTRLNDIVEYSELRITHSVENCRHLDIWNNEFELRKEIYDKEYIRKKNEVN